MSNISYRRCMCRSIGEEKTHSMTGIMSTWSYYYVYQWFRISVAFYRQIDSWAKKQATRERGNHQNMYKTTKQQSQRNEQRKRGKSTKKKLRGKICKWHLFLVHSSIFFVLSSSSHLARCFSSFLVDSLFLSYFIICCCCSFWSLSQFCFTQNWIHR